jgi:large subunit ribosomal protein L18
VFAASGIQEMNKVKRLAKQQLRRKRRVRNKLKSGGRIRLSVFRSNRYFRCQAIDDTAGNTVASAWSGEIASDSEAATGCDAAAQVGRLIAERLLAAGIKLACLDRGEYRYHGRVKAFADGARGAGLEL